MLGPLSAHRKLLERVHARSSEVESEKRLGTEYVSISIRSRLALQHMQPKPVEAMPPEAMPPPPPGALIPNIVEQSVESIKAVGVATVHSAKAIGTTTNKPQIEPSARPLRSIDVIM